MSTFFVGQRVRCVEGGFVTEENRVFIGKTGRITARAPYRFWHWIVAIDGADCDINANECCLEPILPEGHCQAELTTEELLPFLGEKVSA